MCDVSIVIPVYNVEKYIEKSLQSIINQSYKKIEIIIVNDGSEDDSINLAEDMLKNSGIPYTIINQQNSGVSNARNKGLKESKGKYIIFIDPDDIISDDYIESLIRCDGDFDISICNYKFINDLDKAIKDKTDKKKIEKEYFLNHFLKRDINFLLTTMLIKKEILIKNNILFNEKIKFSEDQMFMWNVLLFSDSIIYNNARLYGYYLRPNSTMTGSSKEKILESYDYVVDEIKHIENDSAFHKCKLILPRWQLGALYSATKMLNYDDFKYVAKIMESKKIFFRILGIKEIKAIILSLILKNNFIFYKLCRCFI